MLIGIDASRAVSRAPTGTETYSRELIRALLAVDRDKTYRLYTREPVARDFFSSHSNVQMRPIPFPRLWTHVRLSLEMLTQPPDLLFVSAHVLPPIHPRRTLVTIHDLGHLHFPEAHPRLQRTYHTWATKWNARAATHILADSEATQRDIIQFCGIAPDKVTVVYPSYDGHLFRPVSDPALIQATRARLHIDGDYVLAIGTLHPRKNYGRLIQAFSRMTDGADRLVIVGKRGWLYGQIFSEVERLEMQSRVLFLDYVPPADMPVLVSGARLLAFPSLHEGFGLPVLEAQACGTPVVCSMTSSLPEAAGDGALLVDPCDVSALAAAMQRLQNDKALRAKIIANGFENVQRFSWESSARQVLQVIEELAS
jgi:glycosyltransferase involved in cell wall biosynthesis